MRGRSLLAVLTLLSLYSCGGDSTGPRPIPVASVAIAPHIAGLRVGSVTTWKAIAQSASGDTLTGRVSRWTSDDSTVASVADGVVTARGRGATTVKVSVEGVSASAPVEVVLGVVSVTIPDSASVLQGQTVQLSAVVKDSSGAVISSPITWASDNTGKVTVTSTGLVSGVAASDVFVSATVEGVSGRSLISVLGPPTSVAVQPGSDTVVIGTSATLTATARDAAGHRRPVAITWSAPWEVMVSPGGEATAVGAGNTAVTASTGSVSGVAMVTGVFSGPLLGVAVAYTRSCGVTADHVYCWGAIPFAIPGLSDGDTPVMVPVAVQLAGGPAGTAITVSSQHGCFLAAGGAAWCFGTNHSGEIGNDTITLGCQEGPCARTAVPVLGGLSFSQLSAARDRTCGVTITGAAYCWGSDAFGALGNGPSMGSSGVPSPVAGGLVFRAVSAGVWHTCGIAADSAAWCWGRNLHGELGIGVIDSTDTAPQATPVAVSGGRKFLTIIAGAWATCGLEVGGSVSCWGMNSNLVAGGGADMAQPVSVPGATGFTMLAGGGDYSVGATTHMCGLLGSGQVLCWGTNDFGQTGDLVLIGGSTPKAVTLPAAATTIVAGGAMSCAQAGGAWYCWGNGQSIGTNVHGAATPFATRVTGQR